MCQVQYVKEKKEKGKRKLMVTQKYLLNQLKNEKRSPHLQWNKTRKARKKKIEKTREKATKGLINFNKFIKDDVVEPGQRRSFDLRVSNVKQEIINSYRR